MASTKRATVEAEGAQPARALGRLGLFGLTPSWAQLWDAIERADGEVTPEIEAEMQGLISATMDSTDRACGAVYAMEAEASELKSEIARLAKRMAQRAAAADRIRDLIGRCLDAAEMKSIKGLRFTVTRIAGRPSVAVTDASLVPADFMVQAAPSVDKRAIGEVLKSGKSVPGAEIRIGDPGLLIR